MFSKLVIATGNEGKYKEFTEIIKHIAGGDFAGEIVFAPDTAKFAVEETGKTYAENAMLKAKAWADKTGLPCLSDDSGLEVMALGGAPGLFSARIVYGREIDKVAWLLSKMKGVSYRRARFSAALCLCVPCEYTLITEGYCMGNIADFPAGSNGFGYDPVFIPDGHELTFAELPTSLKNDISHRANAFRKMVYLLK